VGTLDTLRVQIFDDLIRQAGYRCVAAAAVCRAAVVARDRHCDHPMSGLERRQHRLPYFPSSADAMQ